MNRSFAVPAKNLDQALALHLLDRLVLYNFFCLAPMLLGTSLQT